jgi:hypothetical protein
MADSKIVREQAEIYRQSFLRHGDAPEATFNTGREVQRLRFERILQHLLPLRSPFSIHDVGAGLCDLHRYLLDQGIDHQYSATDVVPEMIELARGKYPGIAVHRRDILVEEVADRHDFVVLSGVFNIPGKTDREAWDRFVFAMIDRMYAMATLAVSFNFLTSHRSFTDPELHYIEPGRVLDHCVRRLSRFVLIDHGYPLFECTVTLLRPELVERSHDDPALARYFKVTRLEP